jgi:xylose dehydrogenase (NAD/NADP)
VFTASQQSAVSSHLKFVGKEGEITLEPVFYEGKPQELTLKRNGLECTFTVEPVDYFAHCLTAGETPAPDARHGLRDMELVDAIYRSAEENEPHEV